MTSQPQRRGETTLEQLLEFIKESRGFDFTGYKRSSIERRIAKRMADVAVDGYEDYLDYLQLNGDEFAELFNTILINVTSFFRDSAAWEHVATDIVPKLVQARGPEAPLRVWCAGSASGEEAYTVAMVLARVLGDDDFRERVKIYATDVDEAALDQARQGAYLPRQVEEVPRDALERFFERTDQRYVFRKDLRRSVIFGRNDLVQDAPISRIDLLLCRNTLMYFTADAQAQILRRFHFALNDDGVLVLGKSEMLITHSDLFIPVDLKLRLFRKVIRPAMRDRVRALVSEAAIGDEQSEATDLRVAAFDVTGVAHVVLDSTGCLVLASDAARRMFALSPSDLGRPVQDLELSYRPVELRSYLDTLSKERRAIDVRGVRWRWGERERVLDLRLTPLLANHVLAGVSVAYTDVTDADHLHEELTRSKHELEQAYEELQSTVEELETTNEELQSTNEELETTNEELQSTNEELETMNEELQSTNEELETMNDELGHRTLEMNDINTFLETILSTVGLAVVAVDRRQQVRIWNGQAHEMWGLTSEETEDQHLFSLDIGLPIDTFRPQLRTVLSGESDREEAVVEATNRRGRAFQCRVTMLPFGGGSDDGSPGVIMMMESADA